LEAIAAIKAAVGIPVLCNGNTSTLMCVRANMATTGCAGVMSCEGVLHNPLLFSQTQQLVSRGGMRCAVDRFYVHLKAALERHAAAAAPEEKKEEEKKGVDVLYVALEYVDTCLEMQQNSGEEGGALAEALDKSEPVPSLFHPALPSPGVVWYHVKKMCRPELIRYQTLDEIEEFLKTASVQDVHAAVLKTILRRDSNYTFDRGLHKATKKRRKIQDSKKLLKRGRPETW
jgi:tRNA-dihydrouridine synthase